MIENKMQSYLGDRYTDNYIINFINYWMVSKKPRKDNDLDCIYLNGDLCADTIFSVWTPLKFVLDCLNPDEKFYKKDRFGPDPHKFLKRIKNNVDTYLPKSEEVVKELYYFAKLAETRANVMKWPSQGINGTRYDKYYDQMPPTLYNCFPKGDYYSYFQNEIMLSHWITRENLQMFFYNNAISRKTIKPLIASMKPDERRWLTDKSEILEMLQTMNLILEERLLFFK